MLWNRIIQRKSIALQNHHLEAMTVVELSQTGNSLNILFVSLFIELMYLPNPLYQQNLLLYRATYNIFPLTSYIIQSVQHHSRKPMLRCKLLHCCQIHTFRKIARRMSDS